MKRVCVLFFLMLAGISFGQEFPMKNGETAPTIEIFMVNATTGATATGITIADLDLYFRESGAAAATKIDISALAALDSAYGGANGTPNIAKAFEINGGFYRIDLPPTAVDTGVGKRTTIYVTDGTNEGYGIVRRSQQGDTVTVNGNAPYDTANIDGIKTKTDFLPSVTAGDAGGLAIVGSEMGTASVWDALWTSYTTENSFGYIIKRMYDKVMGLRK